MSKEEIKASTEKYIDVVLQQAEDKAGLSMTESLVESTTFIDKLSTSLLIVSGAAITLSVGNSEAVISALGKGTFKALIVLLLVSAIVGFLSKAAHSLSIMILNLAKNLISRFQEIFDEFDKFEEEQIDKVKNLVAMEPRSPSLERIFESFINTLPKFVQNKARQKALNNNKDGKSMQRAASTLAYLHVMLFGVQALLLILAFVSAVSGVE